jgi:hypothetical protein
LLKVPLLFSLLILLTVATEKLKVSSEPLFVGFNGNVRLDVNNKLPIAFYTYTKEGTFLTETWDFFVVKTWVMPFSL